MGLKQLILVLSIAVVSSAFNRSLPALNEVRSLYERSVESEASCKKLLTLLKDCNEKNNPLYCGYRGVATMIMAKHVFNPMKKLSYFKEGKIILEKAIRSTPNDIELRLLRYQTQLNLPFFLGYDDNLEEDKKFLESKMNEINDAKLKELVREMLGR